MSASPSRRRAPRSSAGRTPEGVTIAWEDLHSLGLTPRECEVLHWISEGKRDREIGIILGLSPRTVGNHAYKIFRKLNVETRTAAARHCALALSAILLAK